MKQFTIIILSLFGLCSLTLGQSYSGGSGTSENPYQIANKADLKELSTTLAHWDKHFIQTADITFTDADFESGGDFYNLGEGFIPIGYWTSGSQTANPFTGSYNGNNQTISNIYINKPSIDYISFFGMVEPPASISNLIMVDVDITGKDCVGGIAGRMTSEIENCYVQSGNVHGNSIVGGLLGYNNSNSASISLCSSGATVYSDGSSAGGLIGTTVNTPTLCFSTGEVSGTGDVGGLIGSIYTYFFDTKILSNCYSKANVTRNSGSTSTSLGAFIGNVEVGKEEGHKEQGHLTIQNCYSTGNVIYTGASLPSDKGFIGYITPDGGTLINSDNFFICNFYKAVIFNTFFV
jgi:hypothetical protein